MDQSELIDDKEPAQATKPFLWLEAIQLSK